ncbi:hypothetical protein [Pyxidicoccus xibeiensis]|uniref:hypothetical protein n=1 Tax=Pyxidicoccus xibeiensis TaxID=2906759 RepID=UPI0020A82174|nr:hypothetical protein [Pyxidicoccus xibeiensis]MCP3141142.1 hypothetical protein [Pyxidicoccus xibeiensis]
MPDSSASRRSPRSGRFGGVGARAHAWGYLLLAVVLCSTGCAARAPDSTLTFGRLGLAAGDWDTEGLAEEKDAPAASSQEVGDVGARLRRRKSVRLHGSDLGVSVTLAVTPGESVCGGRVPSGWPRLDASEEVLTPFLACASPSDFVALQRTVDMPVLVESLSDWDAVRLGALGPLRADASNVLAHKRAVFLVSAARKYGHARAEVFALFVLHSAFDDEVRLVLRLLAGDRQLRAVLEPMATVREELAKRGISLSQYPERVFRAGDVLRGLGRAGEDALSTSWVANGSAGLELSARARVLPPPYQTALWEVEGAVMRRQYAPGEVTLGAFDHLTFGVPVGFYHLLAGTLQGMGSLAAGEYEQATRELAPAALMVGLYAGGRGMRSMREGAIAGSEGGRPLGALPRLAPLKAVLERLEARLGEGAVGELARYVQASREGALVVAEWGEAGAAALLEARGNAGKAQAWLSEAKSQRAGPTMSRGGAGRAASAVAARVREAAGYTREALEAKLLRAEQEAPGARLPADVTRLKQQHPSVEAPPPGVREGSTLWSEYVTYRSRRLAELEQGQTTKGPLRWEGYREMRGLFARGLDFERAMVALLREDAALPRAQRRWLRDFDVPRIETHVGVWKEKTGLRFSDVLVIEERPPAGQPPLVETISFKSRDLSRMKNDLLEAQVLADASDALHNYGETLNIRRRALNPKGDPTQVQVRRVRLVYEGGDLRPRDLAEWRKVVNAVQDTVEGVEVQLQ